MAFKDWFVPWATGGGSHIYKRLVAKKKRDKRRAKKAARKQHRMQKRSIKASGGHYSGGGKGKKPSKKERRREKREFKKLGKTKQLKLSREEKAYNKIVMSNLKKYGKEKYFRKPVITTKQRGLLDYLSKEGKKFEKIPKLGKDKLYGAARENIMDLLSNKPEAYERFKAPIMSEFQREIIPEIADRFSQTDSQRSSSFQNALADAGGQLGLKLGALKAGLQQSALDRALPYAQAPIEGALAGNQQRLGMASQALGVSPFQHYLRPATLGSPVSPPIVASGGSGYSGGRYTGEGGGRYAPSYGGYMAPGAPAGGGFWNGLLRTGAGAVGAGIGTAVGGPIGGAIGGALGTGVASIFT